MKYIIGLDMGITSTGYSVMMLDSTDEPCRILKMGTRIFEAAENSKDGSSLAAPRRENRGMRRRLRRKRFRKKQIRSLISYEKIMTYEEIDNIYNSGRVLSDIYKIRAESLDRLLTKEEFVRLLIHLSQRRGFKSNRKVEAKDSKSDTSILLNAVKTNQELMQSKGYRTIGEMLYKDEHFVNYKRNKSDDYSNTFARSEYESEINAIFEAQKNYGNEFATDNLKEKYLNIYLSQRAFDEGPGKQSPYAGNQIEKMLGKCTFEHDEIRAVKATYSFEYFNLLSKVNSIKILSSKEKRTLTKEERDKIISLAFNKKAISYASIRKELELSDSEYFNISYGNKNQDIDKIEKKTKFTYLNAYHTFKKAYGNAYISWSLDKKNQLAYALTVYKNDNKIISYLNEKGFDKTEIEVALRLPSFTKTCNLSVKALNKIIPYLEQGMLYNEACLSAFKADDSNKRKFLPANAPELNEIKNPVVRRAISQTIKVINAIIREYGESPTYVNIELARELAKNFTSRKKIEKGQKENQAKNDEIIKRLRNEFGIIHPDGQDLIKFKLWQEQDGICPYSLKRIAIEKLFDIGYTDIDHIIPYSISFDNSYNNKVLVFSSENRMKGNKIPMQYLQGKQKDEFLLWVDSSNLRNLKKKNLLKEEISEEEYSGFKKRNLQDTQYLSRFMLNFLKKYLLISPNSKGIKETIVSVNGLATSYMRKRWGINKIRENGDIHHAVDAVVIACITRGMIKRISNYSKYKETEYVNPETNEILDFDKKTGEVLNRFPLPYKYFRDELKMLCSNNPSRILHLKPLPNYATDEEIKPIFVSRMPKHKVKGAAHLETNRKHYESDGKDYSISKVSLSSLKLKDGEIENYYNPSSDTLLYNALKQRLIQFDGDAKKAFAEPFYKPKSNGSQGPCVKKVKVINKSTLFVPVLNKTAIADNGSMIRVDVFYVNGEGYYLVPIYVSDTVTHKLPNKAIVAHKPYSEWKTMSDDNFVFSLYPNDLINVISNKELKFNIINKESTLPTTYTSNDEFVYYKGTDISSGAISVITHDNTYILRGLGIKQRLSLIEKYQVDVLGNITKCKKEKRMGFK
ncbi:MAG: type II CRISPR RNA-guided endonuclease Cas9 [Ruminococcus sp.]|nr:type II CRISPR RNA-guided endonuclease Cas9 [Ruminococcus sp.]